MPTTSIKTVSKSTPKFWRFFVPLLAVLPFLLRFAVIFSGVTGYVWHGSYKILLLLIPLLWRYQQSQTRDWRLIWPFEESRPSRKTFWASIVIAVAFGFLGIMVTTWLTQFLHLNPQAIQTQLNTRFSINAVGAIVMTALLATVNAGLEELHYRWWLDRELSNVFNKTIGIVCSAAAFAGMHLLILAGTGVLSLPAMLAIFVTLFLAGVVWSLLSRQPGGIHAAWLSHGLTNVILMSWGLHWLGYI